MRWLLIDKVTKDPMRPCQTVSLGLFCRTSTKYRHHLFGSWSPLDNAMPASYPFREYRCLRSLRISGFIPSLGVGNPHMFLLRPAMQWWNRPKGHANVTAVDVPGFTAKLTIQEVREVILPESPFLEIGIIFFFRGARVRSGSVTSFWFREKHSPQGRSFSILAASRAPLLHWCCQ